MSKRLDLILRRLQEQGQDSLHFFESLEPEGWQVKVYTEGTVWTVREVLAHFVSAERGYMRVFRALIENSEEPPKDFDIDAFNASETKRLQNIPADSLLKDFQTTRDETVAFVRTLSDPDLDREGWHPFFGQDRLEKFLKLIYRHNMLHERDVRRALEGESDE